MPTATAARPKTKPSTRRLSEVARHVVTPSGIVSTGWPAVEQKCNEFGDEFDQWQADAGRVILGKRADGTYAATVGGVVLSIPRQVAKTFLVGRIVFALCVLFPGLKVVWTAHRTRTATNTFRALQGYARRRKVAPHVAGIRQANGEQEISFVNGSSIMFGAREQGFGRGFDEIDVEVFDEAQILTEKALEDMVAATNQSRHPHGALLFYMGTPPRPVDPGETFTLRRNEALAHKDADDPFGRPVVGDDMVYIECSADEDADPDDRKQWAKANPSYPNRTPLQSMLRLRKNLPMVESWRREALGIWDSENTGEAIIKSPAWKALHTKKPPTDGEVFYGIKFSPDGEMMALSVALRPADAPIHIEGVFHRSMYDGTRWIVDWLSTRWKDCSAIVVDGKANAPALVKALLSAGCKERVIKRPNTDEVIGAHSMFVQAVRNVEMTAIDDPAMMTSITACGRRQIGNLGGWGFESINGNDITLAESAVMAHFGAATIKKRTGVVHVPS